MNTNTIANDQYSTLFTTECQGTFDITPYPWQVTVGRTLIQASVKKQALKYLCVCPTGGGKSLVFNTVSATIKGVTICVCPLLSLGADQSKKVLSKSGTNCKSIASFHLDELSSTAIKALKTWLEVSGNLASTSIMIFTSPQAFQNYYYSFLDYMIVHNMVRLVVVDKIHLVTHFGSSFRKEFEGLKSKLFKAIKSQIPMLFLTATCSTYIASTLR